METSKRGCLEEVSIRRDWLMIGAIVVAWFGAALLANPKGDFPLMDDWSYGRAVKTLLEEGRLHYDGWNTPTLFLQVLYGALFCLPFGFSFETLRISTLVAGLFGGLGVYVLLREASANRVVATFGSLTVMFNPSYVQHAFSFMTDVPFVALAVASAVFFLRALRTGALSDVALGTGLAACATLVRDIGLAIPLGYGVALFVTTFKSKPALVRASLPLGITLAVLLAYKAIIGYYGITPLLQNAVADFIVLRVKTEGATTVAWGVYQLSEAAFAHLALFVLPLVIVLAAYRLRRVDLNGRLRALLIISVPTFLLLVYWRFWPPSLPVRVFGIMDQVMHGTRPWAPSNEPHLFRQTVWLAEFVATALTLLLLTSVAAGSFRREPAGYRSEVKTGLFGVVTSFALLAPFLIDGRFQERYLLPAVPFFALSLVALSKPDIGELGWPRRILGLALGSALLLGYATISVLYMHDNLLWNRARWDAVAYLVTEKGVVPARIDGGLPVNGWFLFDAEGPLRERYANWRAQPPRWWRNDAADYRIAFDEDVVSEGPLGDSGQLSPGGRGQAIWARNFRGWLPGNHGAIVILRDR
jgi:hypothetical protein